MQADHAPPHRRTLSFAIGESDMTVRSWVQERIGHGQQSAPGWESDVRDPAAAVSGVRAAFFFNFGALPPKSDCQIGGNALLELRAPKNVKMALSPPRAFVGSWI